MYDYKKAARQKRKRKNARRAKETKKAVSLYLLLSKLTFNQLKRIHPSAQDWV
ncbi:hypothetical protein C121_44 [Stenotrophomonas phage C121]|uniref:hypothetical protein n=1 Tax=Stenotrophomonas phage C121 TaxID=2914029 RepID=UPI00232906BB|nr:hypothetical protein PP752_gp44 [Stenotrophomonas phage C121]UKL14777.1 hypothetical protein C121_44 [Stenotrophomonas phage C121]